MSIKVGDLSGVEVKESTGGGSILPVGRHVCRIVEAEESESSNGNPQIVVTLEAVEGEHRGKTIRDWWTFTPKTVEMIKRRLVAVGYEIPEGEFDLKPSELIGRPVEISVKREEYQGEARSKVKFYDPAPHLEFTPPPASEGVDAVDVPF